MTSNEKPRTGLSLYANLLNKDGTSSSATISSAPVTYKQPEELQREEDAAKRNAALRFQPTKRPQPTQRPKPKSSIPKSQSSVPETSSPVPEKTHNGTLQPPPPPPPVAVPPKSTLADWTNDDDDINGFYQGEKRQRGGRKKRKKNKEEAVVVQDWDDIYDPSRPNDYEHYKNSEERYREIMEWKDKLYRHRLKRRASSEMSDEDEKRTVNRSFAPPSSYSFAPPPTFDSDSPAKRESRSPEIKIGEIKNEDHYAPPPLPLSSIVHDDASGEDAYTRRIRLSEIPIPAAQTPSSDPPPPPPSSDAPPPPPPQEPSGPAPTIFKAPVRYALPEAPAELPKTDEELGSALADADAQEDADMAEATAEAEEVPHSSRPGQKGFAQRLMSKYGWSKGEGLGAQGTGIVNPLKVQVEKRKKKSDAEGGGWFGPSKGKILGSKTGKGAETESKGEEVLALSEVVVLKGMVDGLDLEREMEQGRLVQEIGEECGEKYGRVERVFIDRSSSAPQIPVFIKFTSQLSGLRAVQALNGRIFNGNNISAGYYDTDKFEQGIYE